MFTLLVILHVLVSIFLIFVILLQPGKADGMGSMGGGGGGGGTASAVFGGQGSVTFLAKVTSVCAAIFMCTSLTLAYRSSHSSSVLASRRAMAAEEKAKTDSTKTDSTGAAKTDSTGAAGATTAPATTAPATTTPVAPAAPANAAPAAPANAAPAAPKAAAAPAAPAKK